MFNVASCVMITPVSYHGGIGHKPLIMGIGALVMSAGSMVFASPHFLAPQYMVVDSGAADVCPQRGPGQCGSSASSGATNANAFKYFFMVGHALHGVGSSPFFTLGVAYLDQNTPSASASIYMGIFYATSVLGPAMGFLLGGYFLSMYTDITADSSKLGMDSSSNNWVGAWWLGFFGASIIAFFTAFPIASFPRALPTAIERAKDLSRLQKEKRMLSLKQAPSAANVQAAPDALAAPGSQAAPDDQPAATPASQAQSDWQVTPDAQAMPAPKGAANAQGAPDPGATSALPDMQIATEVTTGAEQKRSFANHVKRLLCNPTFVCLTLAACAETMIASGLTGFATKIFISMFGISSSRASSLLGGLHHAEISCRSTKLFFECATAGSQSLLVNLHRDRNLL
nr:solute carrier organic anion transporter family member 4A1-like [Dermacentor andersoni]